ncbi:hypothetical protein F503_01372 [Ophiostoma piceae UAMH 11346]|uniref:Uncharacterized protein n=1 Tax=Ophiostoma piceae (strain UAMH 11346) TaxID=1262450 RepID=S3CDI2_OPHP1|nr:hypothetical protein F503_01372 [Ophiostoma piceae UAMH 11346]
MKLALLLAAASSASAGVLVKRPASPPSVAASSTSSASTSHPRGCRPKGTSLYGCFLDNTAAAIDYCSATGIFVPTPTTSVLEESTTYVTVLHPEIVVTAPATATEVSTVDTTSTDYSTLQSTTMTTSTATSTYMKTAYYATTVAKRAGSDVLEVYDARIHKRDAGGADLPTIHAYKRVTMTATVQSCSVAQGSPTASPVTVVITEKKRAVPTLAGRVAASSAAASASASASDFPCGLSPASTDVSSVCSVFVSSYAPTPSAVTDIIVAGVVTNYVDVTSDYASFFTVTTTIKSTTTKASVTLVVVTSVSTVTTTTCAVATVYTTVYAPV